ncbi:holo-[acyl-carrier-protein] synthase, putative [Hepatocystis sp. ex Piliocolobus tephrosceles]|nr:holo-[acyl-carrier-protein] synthase, putative [Hepatocystis sp. ex Piliocolobus tephrosceles]
MYIFCWLIFNKTYLKILILLFFFFITFEKEKFFPVIVVNSIHIIKKDNIFFKKYVKNERALIQNKTDIIQQNKKKKLIKKRNEQVYKNASYIIKNLENKKNERVLLKYMFIKCNSLIQGNVKIHSNRNKLYKSKIGDNIYEEGISTLDSNLINQVLNKKMQNELYNKHNLFLEISNNQIDYPIDCVYLEKEVRKLINLLKFQNYNLTITFVTSKEMKIINKKYHNKNEPTDVISILSYINDYNEMETKSDNKMIDIPKFKSGDIYLCPDYIQKECTISRIKYEKALINEKSNNNNTNINYHNDTEVNINNSSCNNCEQDEQKNLRGINKLFQKLFNLNERLPFYVLHAFIHLMEKDHVNNSNEYNEFMNIEEQYISKFLKYHKYTQTSFAHHIIGIGCDIVNVDRVYNILIKEEERKKKKFLKKVLNLMELNVLHSKEKKHILNKDNIQELAIYVSKKFAAKEAIVKAIGRGLSFLSKYGLSMNEIEIRNDVYGKPQVYLYDKAKEVANKMGIVNIFLSISDEKIKCNRYSDIKNSQIKPSDVFMYFVNAQALAIGCNA